MRLIIGRVGRSKMGPDSFLVYFKKRKLREFFFGARVGVVAQINLFKNVTVVACTKFQF